MPNGGKRKLLDNAYKPTQAGADHSQNFECNLGMLHTESLKILAAEEEKRAVADRLGRGARPAA